MAKCMFCDTKQVSKEHLWGAWWKDYYPPTNQDLLIRDTHTITILDTNNNLKGEKGQFSNVGDPLAKTTKVVCVNCNNTWMSQIEEKMKIAFHSLYINKTETLSQDFSASIRKWMFLKYCLLDRAYTKLTSIVSGEIPQSGRIKEIINQTREERWRTFHNSKVIPYEFQFFIARSTREKKVGSFNHIPLIMARGMEIILTDTCLFFNGDFIGLITSDENVVKYVVNHTNFIGLRQLVDLNAEIFSINDVISGREFEEGILSKLEEHLGGTLRRNFTPEPRP